MADQVTIVQRFAAAVVDCAADGGCLRRYRQHRQTTSLTRSEPFSRKFRRTGKCLLQFVTSAKEEIRMMMMIVVGNNNILKRAQFVLLMSELVCCVFS